LSDGFVPTTEDEFQIIASGGTSGTFTRLINNVLDNGQTLRSR